MQTVKDKQGREHRVVIVAKPIPFQLSSTAEILLSLISQVENELGVMAALSGTYVRNALLGRYCDHFDVVSRHADHFRRRFEEMRLLTIGANDYDRDGYLRGDTFRNPYDPNQSPIAVRFQAGPDSNDPYATNVDFTVNQFSLRTDARIYAPSFAWRHLEKRLLRCNKTDRLNTIMVFDAISYALAYGFELEPALKEAIKNYFQVARVANRPAVKRIQFLVERGLGDSVVAMLKDLRYPNSDDLAFDIEILLRDLGRYIGSDHERREPSRGLHYPVF